MGHAVNVYGSRDYSCRTGSYSDVCRISNSGTYSRDRQCLLGNEMLSVVIPTHERLSRLRLTLTSVFLQVRDEAVNAEVIVVNDGGCREVMTAVQQVRDQCGGGPTKEVNSSHRGRSAARNLGAAQA